VIEDFPLGDYGNRIPNFSFEVRRSVRFTPSLEDKITDVVMIPGAGEMVYGTQVTTKQDGFFWSNRFTPSGDIQNINMHNYAGKADVLLSLDNMQKILPNLEWVAVVITWFATSTDAGLCRIVPKVEFKASTLVLPADWSVAGINRFTAETVLFIDSNTPTYGGTPSDHTVIQICQELRTRGLKVMLYPMIFVDQITPTSKPWRGRIMPNSLSDANNWFTKTQGYNNFILHYANLMNGKVDAFIIGSELVGMTGYSDGSGNYPCVNKLISLASSVKSIMGASTQITYAADWSEYHSKNGIFNLDPLWIHSAIDFIGIDSYFPLTPDLPQAQITEDNIKEYWEKGEGWNYYYTDSNNRTGKTDYTPNDGTSPYAWKNLERFWNSYRFKGSSNHYHANHDFNWETKVGCSVASGFTGYYGDNAYKIKEDTSTAFHRIIDTRSVNTTNDNYIFCCFIKADGRSKIRLILQDSVSTAHYVEARFTLSGNGSLSYSASVGTGLINLSHTTIELLGDGWYRVKIAGRPSSNANGFVKIYLQLLNDAGSITYTGDNISGILVWHPAFGKLSDFSFWWPKQKPIWFTEFGFPSVDGCANQPNVFYDPSSNESYFPRMSRGYTDFKAQREALNATLDYLDARNNQSGKAGLVPRRFVWTWDARPFAFWPDLEGVWQDAPLWEKGHWVNGKLGYATLGAIVKELLLATGLSVSDFDVSTLTDTVEGFIIEKQMTMRSALEFLTIAYFFDLIESDGMIKAVKRGNISSLTILEDKLVPSQNDNHVDVLNISYAQELELPQKVSVTVLDRPFHYDPMTQTASRQIVESVEHTSVSFPIVMGRTHAKQVADIMLYNTWKERVSFTLTLPPEYSRLEPSDVMTIITDNASHEMRIVKTDMDMNGVIKIEAVAQNSTIYDFYANPTETRPKINVPVSLPDTLMEMIDAPPLPNNDTDSLRIHLAVAGAGQNWNGTALYRSSDGGELGGNHFELIKLFEKASSFGVAKTILNHGHYATWDRGNRVDVILTSGTLSSMTELAVLNGANIALLGNELIQFQNAELIDAKTYRLSNLLRGRQGTEWATGNHAIGDRFILLNNDIGTLDMVADLIQRQLFYKAVTLGKSLAGTQEQDFAYNAISLKPFAPVHITGLRDNVGNLTINWIRRNRTANGWRDGVDTPMSEATERYNVDIIKNGTVIRTFDVLIPEVLYSTTHQITDFGAVQTQINVRIMQISALVGRGYDAQKTL
jgi:hypothetical protein